MVRIVAPLITLCLLGAIGIDRLNREQVPDNSGAYQRRVAEAINLIPYRIGNWVGVDNEIQPGALRILHTNVSLSRTYRNVKTGEAATLLVVQCADSRTLLGHYPPVCYPAQGWNEVSHGKLNLHLGKAGLLATQYDFVHETLGQSAQIVVAHFTVLPDGRTAPNMDLLDQLARERRAKFFGGASVQLIVSASMPDARRQEVFETLVEAASKWIKIVQSGIQS